MKKQVSRLISF